MPAQHVQVAYLLGIFAGFVDADVRPYAGHARGELCERLRYPPCGSHQRVRVVAEHFIAFEQIPLMNAAPVVVERRLALDETWTATPVGAHARLLARGEQHLSEFQRPQRFAARRVDRMKIVEHVEQQPLAALPVIDLDHRMAVSAESIEGKPPLPHRQSRRVRQREENLDEVGAVAVAILDRPVGGQKVGAYRPQVPRALDQMRGECQRLLPISRSIGPDRDRPRSGETLSVGGKRSALNPTGNFGGIQSKSSEASRRQQQRVAQAHCLGSRVSSP